MECIATTILIVFVSNQNSIFLCKLSHVYNTLVLSHYVLHTPGQDSNTVTTDRSRYNNEEPGTDNPSAWDPQVVLKHNNNQFSGKAS